MYIEDIQQMLLLIERYNFVTDENKVLNKVIEEIKEKYNNSKQLLESSESRCSFLQKDIEVN